MAASSSSAVPGKGLWTHVADTLSPALVRVLTILLIVALCLWMGAGIINVVLDLRQSFSSGWAGVQTAASMRAAHGKKKRATMGGTGVARSMARTRMELDSRVRHTGAWRRAWSRGRGRRGA